MVKLDDGDGERLRVRIDAVRHGDGHTRIHAGGVETRGEAQRGGEIPIIDQRGERRFTRDAEGQTVIIKVTSGDGYRQDATLGH